MVKDSKIDKYLEYICTKFKKFNKKQITLCFRYFYIIDFLKRNEWSTASEIGSGTKVNIQNTYTRLRQLAHCGILQIKHSGVQKKYSNNLSEYYVEKLDMLTSCASCGKRVSFFGGYLSENIMREPQIKILCRRGCK